MAKYTDEQIKKAKEHFKYGIDCDIFSEPVLTYAKIALDALDLINRQEAEVEALKAKVDRLKNEYVTLEKMYMSCLPTSQTTTSQRQKQQDERVKDAYIRELYTRQKHQVLR